VILCSIMDDQNYVIEAAKAGAVGYVSKTASPAELLDAVRLAAKGGTCFGPLPVERPPNRFWLQKFPYGSRSSLRFYTPPSELATPPAAWR